MCVEVLPTVDPNIIKICISDSLDLMIKKSDLDGNNFKWEVVALESNVDKIEMRTGSLEEFEEE